MEIKELVKKLRNCGGGTEGIKLVNEAADKIEWLQKLVDDMTNDHFVDTLDFYSERCQNLEEKLHKLQNSKPLRKEEFSKTLSSLKRNEDFIGEINDVFRKFSKDDLIYSTGLEETIIGLLETLFDDKENQWIAYWVWKENFGETYKEGDVTEEDGTIIPLATAEELYDFLVKNMREKTND